MSLAKSLLPEFDQEMATTRSLLERVPEAHAAWRPHEKSMALGELAVHLAELPGLLVPALTQPDLDLSPPGGPAYAPSRWESKAATLKTFDTCVAQGRGALAGISDAALLEPWALKKGGTTLVTVPRAGAVRGLILSHMIHHRGQLSVYLRLQDVPLPAMYGPSADTQM